MNITLLGSGEAVGVPAPLCECTYCQQAQRRHRPSLLVETDDATVVLDISPDITEQLHETGTVDVDAFFLTHHHYDHGGGLHELVHAAMGFDTHVGIEGEYLPADTFEESNKPADPEFEVYLTDTALGHVEESNRHFLDVLDLQTVSHGETVAFGDLCVVPFPVEHARPTFDTLGFAVSQGNSKAVYAPDMREFVDSETYTDADLLFAEGASLFRGFGHGPEEVLQDALDSADADRTILVNLNEHLQRMTAEEMDAVAAEEGYELGEDFAEFSL